MVQLICRRSRPRRPLVVRGRVGNPGRRGECGLVRVRPQPRLLLAGRPIECCVRRPRVGSGGQARCRALACRRQDIRRLWEDRARRRLDGGGCRIQNRRGDRIGAPGFDFDAAVTGARIERQSLRWDLQVNDDGRCCDNADRDEVEQGAKVRLWCPDAVIRKIGGRTRRFGGFVDPRFGRRAVVPARRTPPFRAFGGASRDRPFPVKHYRYHTRGGWRPEGAVLVIET
jgi:hypothetical protein